MLDIELTDLDPPRQYRLKARGQGGAAGFARGEALIRLEEIKEGIQEDTTGSPTPSVQPSTSAATQLSYEIDFQAGGKLMQLGSRLMVGLFNKLSTEFFTSLEKWIEEKG